jgi:hypothetical protein
MVVLVHESLAPHVQPWQSSAQQPTARSPFHFWLRFDAASGLHRPLYLAAAYLPPYRSTYGLKSAQQLEEFFCGLGDEVAAVTAQPGGADVLLVGDLNCHVGAESDLGEYTALLEAALGGEAEGVLVPCAGAAPPDLPPRRSCCSAKVCPQGEALLQFCRATGVLIMNGRLPGDELGSPTCFAGSPSVIDLMLTNSSFLLQAAARLRVLAAVPEYQVHRPLELIVALDPARAAGAQAHTGPSSPQPRQPHQPCGSQPHHPAGSPQPQPAAPAEDNTFGPPPSFPPNLSLKEHLMPAFTEQLQQPEVVCRLQAVAELADSSPEAAASQLSAAIYEAAAVVFPVASAAPPSGSRRQQQRQHQPWFDRECELARQRLRAAMADSRSHLCGETLRMLSSRYTLLRKRKAALWRAQRSKALLQLHSSNPRSFFKQWKPRPGDNPISAAAWLRHFVHLQRKRVFKPSQQASPAAAAAASSPASAGPQPSPEPQPSAPASPQSPPGNPCPPAGADLDQDWTADDVNRALKKLSAGSACLGPLKAALIKAGGGLLVPVLARLFTAVFRSGCAPREWLLGAITAIHKKGDATEPNNYRGITVGHVLGKLYALMLNARLSAWAEASGVRAVGQGGFRQGFRTTDNCFVLRALVERARAQGNKLYICAVDLEKAFDSVDRPLLWAALQRAGIGGCMLATIQALYADVPVCVKTAGGLSSTFQSIIGVKQGCPLSPLLFGLFLDDFEQHVQRTLGAATACLPVLAGRNIPPLLFADDMLLISTSPAGLRAQLLALQSYCDSKKLTVNAAKTQVMIMRPGGGSGGRLAADEVFSYAGKPLEVVKATKYLGLTFAQLSKRHGFACCAEELARAGRRALFAMRRRAWEMGAGATEHQLRLFDIFVQPVLSYGCEVWGVDLLGQLDCAPERVHRWFCRRLLGLPQGASSAVALAELGRWPLHVHWVRQLCRFWNRLLEVQGEERLVRWAFQDSLELMREQQRAEALGQAPPSPCWTLKWFRFLQSAPTDTGTLVWLTELDEAAVVQRAQQAYLRAAAGGGSSGPTSAGSGGPAAAGSGSQAAPCGSGSMARGASDCCNPAADPTRGIRSPAGHWRVSPNPPPDIAAVVGCGAGPGARGGVRRYGGISPASGLWRADRPPPQSGSRPANKFAVYLECVRGDAALGVIAPHLMLDAVRVWEHRVSLTRFRCSSHDLRVERDRYLPEAVKPPRHQRTCLLCGSGSVEDESHMVFHCPLYDSLRFKFADLFSATSQTLPCFLQQNQDRVAEFVHSCFTLRSQMTQMSLAGS